MRQNFEHCSFIVQLFILKKIKVKTTIIKLFLFLFPYVKHVFTKAIYELSSKVWSILVYFS